MRPFSSNVFFLGYLARTITWVILLSLTMTPTQTLSDTLHLKDGSQLEGRLERYDAQGFTFRAKDGSRRLLSLESVAKVDVLENAPVNLPARPSSALPLTPDTQAPTPAGPYDTPLHTFWSWRKAAISDDLAGMVQCYSRGNQKQVKKELKKISKSKRKEMQEAAIQTYFFPNDPVYQGPRASLEVTWQKGLASDIQILQFILEGREWKIAQ